MALETDIATAEDASADRRIQQLSPALVNRIAAGEVIERPASVVKELVENSIDSGARQIVVEIEQGGRELIRIVDDGCGIPADELPMAFASHATSKLRCDEDLMRIATMGFRGEALASIGSVSHARILSRPEGQDFSAEIANKGSVISEVQQAAGNAGTTIEVRHLFFNVPARRKFLKGASTELGHVQEALMRLALPHADVAFKLFHGGRKLIDLPATDARSRWLEAWPKEFAEMCLPVNATDAELKITGVVGLPELAKPAAKHQYVYLNGRHIRDRIILHALKEAYRGLTEPGRYPPAILLLEVPPADVDVNVHPTKTEVRWKESGRIYGLVLSGVREKLLGSDLTPAAQPRQNDEERQGLRQQLAAFFKAGTEEGESSSPTPVAGNAPRPENTTGLLRPPSANSSAEINRSPEPATDLPTVEVGAAEAAELAEGAVPAMQLHNSYLVVQTAEGLQIIDQHALHERIIYEDLLARVRRGQLEGQRLLIPPVIHATADQLALVDSVGELFKSLGIELQRFGPDAVAVHAFPSLLSKLDPESFIAELLDTAEQDAGKLSDEELVHEVLDMMSCKAAVKAGDPLSAEEIQALLDRRDLIDRSSNCPHGRPTTLRLTLRDLEKQFKRTGF